MTGARSLVGRAVANVLAPDHQLVVLDHEPFAEFGEWRDAADWSVEHLTTALEGTEVLVAAHLHAPSTPRHLPPDHAALDVAGRLTYNLILAARAAGVPRLLMLTTLENHRAWDPNLRLNEFFGAQPSERPEAFAFHLAECICREVRQQFDYRPFVIRLGQVVLEEDVAGQPYDPFWVDARDAAAVIAALLPLQPKGRGEWRGLLHVCADRPDAASRTGHLKHWLGVEMHHRFGYQEVPA